MKFTKKIKIGTKAFSVFQKGKKVANPKLWRAGQITVSMLTLLILDIIGLGCTSEVLCVSVGEDQINLIAAGIIASVNLVFEPAFRESVGLSSESKPDS